MTFGHSKLGVTGLTLKNVLFSKYDEIATIDVKWARKFARTCYSDVFGRNRFPVVRFVSIAKHHGAPSTRCPPL